MAWYGVLYDVVYFSFKSCGSIRCGVLYVVGSNVVWCYVMWCGVMWRGEVWCSVVWCGVMWCGVVLCGLILWDVVWFGVMWCSVMWCGVMWCDVEMLLVSNSLSPVPLPTLALEDLGGREVPVNRLLLSVTLNILSGPGTVEPAEQPPATTAISQLVDGENKETW